MHRLLLRRLIRFAGSCVVLDFDPVAAELVDFLFPGSNSSSIESAREANGHTFRLTQSSESGEYDLEYNGRLERRAASLDAVAIHLMDAICFRLIDECRDGLVFHAALVSRNRRALLLPAEGGSGKSTLAAWLVRQGFDYGSDEFVWMDFEANCAEAFERPINLKQHSAAFIETTFGLSGLDKTSRHINSPPVTFYASDLFGPGKVHSEVELAAVIFPRYRQTGEFLFEPISKAQAGLGWMKHLLNARNLHNHGFSQISWLARSIPAYKLEYSRFDQLNDVFAPLLDRQHSQSPD